MLYNAFYYLPCVRNKTVLGRRLKEEENLQTTLDQGKEKYITHDNAHMCPFSGESSYSGSRSVCLGYGILFGCCLQVCSAENAENVDQN